MLLRRFALETFRRKCWIRSSRKSFGPHARPCVSLSSAGWITAAMNERVCKLNPPYMHILPNDVKIWDPELLIPLRVPSASLALKQNERRKHFVLCNLQRYKMRSCVALSLPLFSLPLLLTRSLTLSPCLSRLWLFPECRAKAEVGGSHWRGAVENLLDSNTDRKRVRKTNWVEGSRNPKSVLEGC